MEQPSDLGPASVQRRERPRDQDRGRQKDRRHREGPPSQRAAPVDVPELGLAGRVAFGGGGRGGRGRAGGGGSAKSGGRAAVGARRKDVLERAADAIRRATGGDILAMATDVTHGPEIEAFVAATGAQFGGVDILVNNAGTSSPSGFEQVDEATRQYDFDLKGLGAIRPFR